jgi:hypothetical protein
VPTIVPRLDVADLGDSVRDEVRSAASQQIPVGVTNSQKRPHLQLNRREAGTDEGLEFLRSLHPLEAGVGIGELGRVKPGHLDLLELAAPAAPFDLVPQGLGRQDDEGDLDPTE